MNGHSVGACCDPFAFIRVTRSARREEKEEEEEEEKAKKKDMVSMAGERAKMRRSCGGRGKLSFVVSQGDVARD